MKTALSRVVVISSLTYLASCADVVGAEFDGRHLRQPAVPDGGADSGGGGAAPVAGDLDLGAVVEGTQNNPGQFPTSDPEGDRLTHRIVAQPLLGNVTITDEVSGAFSYAPTLSAWTESDFIDSFQYQVSDGKSDAARAGIITVRVLPAGPLEVLPDTPPEYSQFGRSIAIEGNTAIVGDPLSSPSFDIPIPPGAKGALYIYTLQGSGAWEAAGRVDAPQEAMGNTNFGCSVALSGDWALAGAYGSFRADSNTVPGQAFFYKRNQDGVFELKQRVIAPAAQRSPLDRFGFDVELEGSMAIVGSFGTVYTYTLQGETWAAVGPPLVTPNDGGGEFGWDTSLDRDFLAVGSPSENHGSFDVGAVHTYARVNEQWENRGVLFPVDLDVSGFRMGSAVALSQDHLIAGAEGLETLDKPGNAYIFKYQRGPGTWSSPRVLSRPEGALKFGQRVGIDHDIAFVTMRGQQDVGEAFVFRFEDGEWKPFSPPIRWFRTGLSDRYGWGNALHGQILAIGAFSHLPSGSAYFYNIPKPGVR